LQKASDQIKTIEDSIKSTEQQKTGEDKALKELKQKLDHARRETDAKRLLLDEKRTSTDSVRSMHLQTQRLQFDAEKTGGCRGHVRDKICNAA
jgi:ribosome-interacting GTPase 1